MDKTTLDAGDFIEKKSPQLEVEEYVAYLAKTYTSQNKISLHQEKKTLEKGDGGKAAS